MLYSDHGIRPAARALLARPRHALLAAVVTGVAVGSLLAGLGGIDGQVLTEPREADPVFAQAPLRPLSISLNDPVRSYVDRFTGPHARTMSVYLTRSGRYEGMIRSMLRERNMPEELFYLSMIESGFVPTARSPAQAVGLWQFIPETGRRYGLRIDRYVDERRDPERSTDAALRYLEYMYGRFGSWQLAAAGYNTGENRVGRIMREVTGDERGADEDYWRIRHRLPRETQNYVPQILAAALIGEQPELFGLDAVERWSPLATEPVRVPPGTSLAALAAAAGVGEEEIRRLNPSLLRGITPPDTEYVVHVPEGRGVVTLANLGEVMLASRSAPVVRTHSVVSGESLWVIARRTGSSVSELQRANGLGVRSTLRPGQRLTIPG